jgi:tRNA(fMet)-specific endonuclease VapC
MLVLDTDILTIIQRASSVEYAPLIARLPANDPLSVHVTIITVEEQLRGWLSYVAKARTRDKRIDAYSRLRGFIRDLSARQILDFDGAAADKFEQLVKAKLRVGSMDLKSPQSRWQTTPSCCHEICPIIVKCQVCKSRIGRCHDSFVTRRPAEARP